MKYTKEQKEQMIKKLMDMPNNHKFVLNKKDVCPLNVIIEKKALGSYPVLAIRDAETGSKMVSASGNDRWNAYKNLVDLIEEMINDWDIVTKQHFIDLARKMGYDD